MSDAPRAVGLFAHQGSSLGAALAAALEVRGWVVDAMHEAAWIDGSAAQQVVLVIDVGDDRMPEHLATVVARNSSKRWICLGSLAAAQHLVSLARLGVVVLNPDVPFLLLLSGLEHLLLEGRSTPSTDLAVAIACRAAEAAALAPLTVRERTVLCQLMRGSTVDQIAEQSTRTIHTIRSQVQSVLRRLGVRSQVEAIAIGHRSGTQTPLAPCLERIHQY